MGTLRNKLLVLNAGSSSLKFKIFEILQNPGQLATIRSGLLERIGDPAKSRMKVGHHCAIFTHPRLLCLLTS